MLQALDPFLKVEYNCIVFFFFNLRLYPGVFDHFSLDYYISVKTGIVQIQRLF